MNRKSDRGQVAVEYALATMIVVSLAAILWLFYQGFVQANLYGGSASEQNELIGFSREYHAMGLERVASLPFP